jgi:porin
MAQGRRRRRPTQTRPIALALALLGLLPALPPLAARADATPFTLQSALKLPDWMNLQVAFSGEPLFNPVGGLTATGAWVQQSSIDLALSTGLSRDQQQWRELDHWGVNVNIGHTTGNQLFNSDIGAVFPLQQVAYPPGFWLSEASLERDPGAGWLGLKAGILAMNPDFIQVPILNLYVHASLNNTLNIVNTDLPINPYASPGGVVTLRPSDAFKIRYGIYDIGSTFAVSQALGADPALADGIYGTAQVLQIDYTGAWLAPDPKLPMKVCRETYGLVRSHPRCERPTTVTNQLPGGLVRVGGITSTDNNTGEGVYGSVTLRSGLPIGLDERVWFGGAYSPNRTVDFAPTFVGGGMVVQGVVRHRPLDLLVLGIGRGGLTSEAPPFLTSSYEGMAELGYRVMINEWLQLQPTVQWIFNPSGADQPVPGILAAGLRIDLNF